MVDYLTVIDHFSEKHEIEVFFNILKNLNFYVFLISGQSLVSLVHTLHVLTIIYQKKTRSK